MKCAFFTVVFSLLCSISSAQTWESVDSPSHEDSVVRIDKEGGGGSGVVVKKLYVSEEYPEYYMGLILTAGHCVDYSTDRFTITFYDSKKTRNAGVVKDLNNTWDKDNDLALLKGLIPIDIEPIEIHEGDVDCGSELILSGYGQGSVRHWKAQYGAEKTNDGHIIFSWAIQGDSGGPIVYNGKLIGVICYGNRITFYEGTRRLIVCPIYASNISRLRDFINEYK